ncbi:relaxase/mobilization nuclease domain-containing protein [Flavobacterium proteolyticum]|uniref:Relaxase/mobilization nuclease domain-containing protein n=1 Tax=Flavobacterium proteolyticum TaxID=2911683 RepID=A0ABR9WV12_9FLAO|nr:relaxase/mobilization nuclease domain-containing protein [Flavobacterium proteolyticum]MBE9577506.1 relaxase/mobilization nuclease domain-containing protein [Flavobacterium proteolyticum]
MIAVQIKGRSFKGVLLYNQNKVDKGEAIVLDTNLSSESVVKQTKEFNIVRQQKPNLSKAVYHVSLNLPYEDSKKLSDDKFANLARDYLEGMGFDENQYITYKHFDQDHSHIHIVANRVNFSGNVVSDSHDYKRSETLIRKLEQKYNLTELVRKEESNVLSKGEIEKCLRTGESPDRLVLQSIINELLKQHLTMHEFFEKLKGKEIEVKLNKSSTGLVSGISFKYREVTYKGSKIHRSLSYNNLTKKVKSYEQERINNSISANSTEIGKTREETRRTFSPTEEFSRNYSRKPENYLGESKANEKPKPRIKFRR